ncbi:MerR family transcriptional regulator [Nonomuraea harbinensis]|uniref:MerR family transcriptional regulator n=1 Tax=Nonomuraea harbinensis TaxID=1286938 RepID=A0ABW1BWZ3_9ACTN|nr:MerR family transcriptional regulator [Nonomuraea harbinensis]
MLLIGEVAKLAGVTPRTVRHYHRIGLLAEPERTAGGYRTYGIGALSRLLQIRKLTALGMGLGEVADALTDTGGMDVREAPHGFRRLLSCEENRWYFPYRKVVVDLGG